MILLCLLAACQQHAEQKAPVDTTPEVAQVGDRIFHESDIDAEIDALPEKLQSMSDNPALRARVLHTLMRRYALSSKALEMHMDDDPVIQHRILRARNDILIQYLQQWKMEHLPVPAEEKIRAYYKAHKSDFSVPAQVHVRHILVGTKKQAGAMIRKLKHGADFAALATAHSLDDGSKARGGDLNWFPRGVMVKSFEKAAFGLKKPGDISGPIKTKYGWHVIELLGKRPASQKSLAEVREDIVNILKQKDLSAWEDGLLTHAESRIIKPDYRKRAATR
ncbi:MAG TPA: peptidylprolyl isomerase [Mariprofundaceae bacterium]|nr:peptidylprolyl isomerase [Mariprofundaceae bacterium]